MYVVEHQPAGAVCSSMFHGWNLTDPLHLLVLPTCVRQGAKKKPSWHGNLCSTMPMPMPWLLHLHSFLLCVGFDDDDDDASIG